jgi:hypothetical protein
MGACASALGSGLQELEDVYDVEKLLGEVGGLQTRRYPIAAARAPRAGARNGTTRRRLLVAARLAQGVEGKVYLCRHKLTNERVAVKLVPRGIDAEERQRLQREIQLQACLFHVNIAELKQVVLTRKHLGIVMEYVPGGTLWQFCSRWGGPAPRLAAEGRRAACCWRPPDPEQRRRCRRAADAPAARKGPLQLKGCTCWPAPAGTR